MMPSSAASKRISEAAFKLGDMATHPMPDQPWQKIRSFGNVLRHEYDSIQADRLFEVVRNDLPGLLAATKKALQQWDES